MTDQVLFERNLLPPNATRYMRALESGMRVPEDVWQAAGLTGSAKALVPDAVLPFLLWEYGLEPVMRWIADPRVVLEEGRAWQRIRGTPQAIIKALSWANVVPLDIEEASRWEWWDLFQIGLPAPNMEQLEAIIGLTRLSKAAHSDVIRIFSPQYDLREHRLNRGTINGPTLINDWSGVWVQDGWPKISFGRRDGDNLDAGSEIDFATASILDIVQLSQRARGFLINWHRVNSPELMAPAFALSGPHFDDTSITPIGALSSWQTGGWTTGPWGGSAAAFSPSSLDMEVDGFLHEDDATDDDAFEAGGTLEQISSAPQFGPGAPWTGGEWSSGPWAGDLFARDADSQEFE